MARTSRAASDATRRSEALAEVQALAWLLDNSIPVPGTGRRFGIDALIGLVPGIGDAVSGVVGVLVVWRATRMNLPRIVVARMLLNTLLDVTVGAIPVLGDAFDLWFKANTRNLNLMRRYVAEPDTSTRSEWTSVGLMAAAVVLVIAVVGWLVVSAIAAIVTLLSTPVDIG